MYSATSSLVKVLFWLVTCNAVLLGCTPSQPNVKDQDSLPIRPPVADARPHLVESAHGSRVDNYYWLRDDTRTDPEVLAYLRAENEYTTKMLAHIKPLEDELFDEINERIKKDDSTVPYRHRGYYYYTRVESDYEYPIYARKKDSPDSPEDILLDVNRLASGHEYYHVGDFAVSPNGDMLAYTEDTLGRRLYTIRFKNLKSGEILPDALPGSSTSVVWANDNETIFYLEKDPVTLWPGRVKRHRLGTNPEDDILVYAEADDSFYLTLGRSGDERYLLIEMESTLTNEIRYLDADDATGEFNVLLPREEGHEFEADHIDDQWIIKSNWQAKNFRILQVNDESVDDRSTWREIVPSKASTLIHGFDLFDDFLVVDETANALRRLRVLDRSGRKGFVLDDEQPVYVIGFDINAEQHTKRLRYTLSSLTTPDSIYEIDMETRGKRLLKQDRIPGGFNSADYRSERLWAKARDGTRIPISLVHHRKTSINGTAPLYQYGYGAYGYSIEPEFDENVLSLLDRGFVFAIAHVRGGQEMGRNWYEAGKLLNKKNTYTDFIDVTEFLIAQGYAHPDKVIANGRSAGGLLAGAIANMRPELYRLIVADVPFVDAVTTMLDESIPLTTLEFDEWGNPQIKAHYDYILDYSPYDNVRAQDYPALLITTGFWDSQVQYYESAKWVAKLRALKTDDNPLLFHINMEAGHSGRSGRFRQNRELAMQYAFILDLLGMTKTYASAEAS